MLPFQATLLRCLQCMHPRFQPRHRTAKVSALMAEMWGKQCHLHHPPVITIFTGGMFTIPKRMVYGIVLCTLVRLEYRLRDKAHPEICMKTNEAISVWFGFVPTIPRQWTRKNARCWQLAFLTFCSVTSVVLGLPCNTRVQGYRPSPKPLYRTQAV